MWSSLWRLGAHLAPESALALAHPWSLLAAVLRSPIHALDRMTATHHRYLDRAIALLGHNPVLFPSGMFCDGWGDLQAPRRMFQIIRSQEACRVREIPVNGLEWTKQEGLATRSATVMHGRFRSTLANAQEFLPKESLDAYCELVTPIGWETKAPEARELVVLLPATGEHGYLHRRVTLALPLAQLGVATLILEGPFYGRRRPPDQRGSKLRRVSDLPILGQATIEEAKSLISYFQRQYGCKRVVLAGSSMGGLISALTASVFPGPVGVTGWLAPPSAVPVFTDGLLAASCNWKSLYKQHEINLLDKMLQGVTAESSALIVDGHGKDPVQEAKKRLRVFLSITDLDYYPVPQRTDAVVFVVGTEDEYIGSLAPKWKQLQSKWRSTEVRYVHAGHISGILLQRDAYVSTIREVLARL